MIEPGSLFTEDLPGLLRFAARVVCVCGAAGDGGKTTSSYRKGADEQRWSWGQDEGCALVREG